ncbi:MAG: WD40/YVTN/BNR-like repeat-containing protein, partial [Salibacteraceae bacterium]
MPLLLSLLTGVMFSFCTPSQETIAEKDRRAAIGTLSRMERITIAPNGEIWLARKGGCAYYTNSLDSNWHIGPDLSVPDDPAGIIAQEFRQFSFFNDKVGLITGEVSFGTSRQAHNGYLRTTDAGKHWELLDLGMEVDIKSVHAEKDGKVWLVGTVGQLLFSNDYGKSWTQLASPFDKSNAPTCLLMAADGQVGFASGYVNHLYTTDNNWKTCRNLPTPLDQLQKKVGSKKNRLAIEQVLLWNNQLLVLQNGNLYHSAINS